MAAGITCSPMCGQMTWLTALTLVLTLPGALSVYQTVKGTAGQSITLPTGVTGLHGDSQVVWSYGLNKELLLDFDSGKLLWNKSEKFHLNHQTGALTINFLDDNDSGLYQGEIINGSGSQHYFNLTVVGVPKTVKETAGQNIPLPTGVTGPHDHQAAVEPLCFFVVLLVACAATLIAML